MEIEAIKRKAILCLKNLVENEKTIIQNDINERTIAHKYAEYLQQEFGGLNVDIEYNRNIEEGDRKPKYADIIKTGYEESYRKAKENGESVLLFLEQVTTYPDIIVHERSTNRKNTLVIEVKKENNTSDWSIDEKKLEAFTRRREDEGYGYLLGMHLLIYINKKWKEPTYIWYRNGVRE